MVCPCAGRKGGKFKPVPRIPKVDKPKIEINEAKENSEQKPPKKINRHRWILTRMPDVQESVSQGPKVLGGFLPETRNQKRK